MIFQIKWMLRSFLTSNVAHTFKITHLLARHYMFQWSTRSIRYDERENRYDESKTRYD